MVHTTLHTATLSYRGTKVSIQASKELALSACTLDVTACFTSVSTETVSNVLPKGWNEMEVTGPREGDRSEGSP